MVGNWVMYQRTFQLVKKYVCFILVLLVLNLTPQIRGQLNYTPKGDKTIKFLKKVSPKLGQVGDVLLPPNSLFILNCGPCFHFNIKY